MFIKLVFVRRQKSLNGTVRTQCGIFIPFYCIRSTEDDTEHLGTTSVWVKPFCIWYRICQKIRTLSSPCSLLPRAPSPGGGGGACFNPGGVGSLCEVNLSEGVLSMSEFMGVTLLTLSLTVFFVSIISGQ
jgi:hypothetical protein